MIATKRPIAAPIFVVNVVKLITVDEFKTE